MFSQVDLFLRCSYIPNLDVLSLFQCRKIFFTAEGFTDCLNFFFNFFFIFLFYLGKLESPKLDAYLINHI